MMKRLVFTESNVDGIHPNGFNMRQYADAYAKNIHAILNEK